MTLCICHLVSGKQEIIIDYFSFIVQTSLVVPKLLVFYDKVSG